MLSQSKNRVQAIKNKFENLNVSSVQLKSNKKSNIIIQQDHLYQQRNVNDTQLLRESDRMTHDLKISEPTSEQKDIISDSSNNNNITVSNQAPLPNTSYLYKSGDKTDNKRPILTRQTSDPASKLHRRHAFRCSRNEKIKSFHRECSFISSKSESSKNTFQTNVQIMFKTEKSSNNENIDPKIDKSTTNCYKSDQSETVPHIPILNMEVPKYILDQYAQVMKPKKQETKPELMTDSGVGSETENVEEERKSLKLLKSMFETAIKSGNEPSETNPIKTNLLQLSADITTSTETMRLEKKNPHLVLTDTLKKALRQPLPSGPPPKKPPRTFNSTLTPESPTKPKKKDAKEMLHKLEQVLQERETQKDTNIYDIPETVERDSDGNSQKSNHYLCTEILNISQRSSLPFERNPAPFINCFSSLNCAIPITNSTTTLPYKASSGSNPFLDDLQCSNSSNEILLEKRRLSTFFKSTNNNVKNNNLDIGTQQGRSQFFVPKEHIYDIPYDDIIDGKKFKTMERKSKGRRSEYGIVNSSLVRSHSKSMSDLSAIKKLPFINIKKSS